MQWPPFNDDVTLTIVTTYDWVSLIEEGHASRWRPAGKWARGHQNTQQNEAGWVITDEAPLGAV